MYSNFSVFTLLLSILGFALSFGNSLNIVNIHIKSAETIGLGEKGQLQASIATGAPFRVPYALIHRAFIHHIAYAASYASRGANERIYALAEPMTRVIVWRRSVPSAYNVLVSLLPLLTEAMYLGSADNRTSSSSSHSSSRSAERDGSYHAPTHVAYGAPCASSVDAYTKRMRQVAARIIVHRLLP